MADGGPRRGDYVLRVTRRQVDLAFEGRLTHVTLDAPLPRGPLFFALSDQIVATVECRPSYRVSSISEWHQRYPEHRNTSNLLPYPKTYLAEFHNIRRLHPFMRLVNGPPRTLLLKLGARSVAPAHAGPRGDEPPMADADAAVQPSPADGGSSSTPDSARARASARAMGASLLEASLAAGTVAPATDRGASELSDHTSSAERVCKRPASADLREVFRRQRACIRDGDARNE